MRSEEFDVMFEHGGILLRTVGTRNGADIDYDDIYACTDDGREFELSTLALDDDTLCDAAVSAVSKQLEAEYEGLREEAADKRRKLDE